MKISTEITKAELQKKEDEILALKILLYTPLIIIGYLFFTAYIVDVFFLILEKIYL